MIGGGARQSGHYTIHQKIMQVVSRTMANNRTYRPPPRSFRPVIWPSFETVKHFLTCNINQPVSARYRRCGKVLVEIGGNECLKNLVTSSVEEEKMVPALNDNVVSLRYRDERIHTGKDIGFPLFLTVFETHQHAVGNEKY